MDRMSMIFKLLQSLDKKLDDQGESLTRVEADLKYHIKRTDLLEGVVGDMDKRLWLPSLKQVGIIVGIMASVASIAAGLKWL